MANLSVNQHLHATYDAYYNGEARWRWLGARDKASNIIALCHNRKHDTILEIGAGEGSVLQRLFDAGFGNDMYALEISKTALEAIQERAIPTLRDCRLFDGYEIPYAPKQFDLAILSHVLEHVEYPRKLIYEASRVAVAVLVEVPLEHTIRRTPDFVGDNVGHINFYTARSVRWLLQSCGLTVVEQVITIPSREVMVFQYGRTGVIKHFVKSLALRLLPRLATALWTYHSALLCTISGEDDFKNE